MRQPYALPIALAFALGGAPPGAGAQDAARHSRGASSETVPDGSSIKPSLQIALMDTQLKAMGKVHDKMMAAKSQEERDALMPEHMQAMQDAATMMNAMAARGMTGMTGDMAAHRRMMEKRMEMMQATMQLMMDRLQVAPVK